MPKQNQPKLNSETLSSESTTVEWKQSLAEMDEVIQTAVAFANTSGGRIYIGVSPAGKIVGVQIGKGTLENLVNQIAQNTDPKLHPKVSIRRNLGKDFIVVDIKESPDHLMLAFGRPYKRVGRSTVKMTKNEYEQLILETHKSKLYFDEHICRSAAIKDISKDKLIRFVNKANEHRGLSITSESSATDILRKLKLMRRDKLTNAAILLFGKDTPSFFLQAEIKLIRFKGIDETRPMLDFKTIGGDVITLLEKAENFIFDHIPMKAWIESGKLQRQEKWLYPPDAIREALANALAHRDYSSAGKVQVRIFDDRLEIWNPGLLPLPLTIAKLKGKHDSIPRNPLIAKAFFWIKLAEELGSGTSKIIKWCKEWGLPEPTYEEAGGSFVTIFHNPVLVKNKYNRAENILDEQQDIKIGDRVGDMVGDRVGDKTSGNQQRILELIAHDATISAAQLASIVGISKRKIEENISKLQTLGRLMRIGPDNGGHWKITE